MSASAAPTRRTRGRFEPRLVVVIAAYALKACFPKKRLIGLVLPAAGALLFAVLSQVIPDDGPEALALVANGGLFGVVLPVGCLIIGDAVLGAEVRSGTIHFTWLSPASFAAIVAGRWLAGCAAALVALVVPFGLAAIVAGVPGAVGPLALAAAAGSAAYIGVFLTLGALTRRAVVWSLGFVLLGERLLGAALSGIAQWSPGWQARAVYAELGPDAAEHLHRARHPRRRRRRRPVADHRRRGPDHRRAAPGPPAHVGPVRRLKLQWLPRRALRNIRLWAGTAVSGRDGRPPSSCSPTWWAPPTSAPESVRRSPTGFAAGTTGWSSPPSTPTGDGSSSISATG